MSHTPYAMSTGNDKIKMVMLFFIALLLLNFPVLSIFGKGVSLFGIPILYLYIFMAWLLIIFLIFWFTHSKQEKD